MAIRHIWRAANGLDNADLYYKIVWLCQIVNSPGPSKRHFEIWYVSIGIIFLIFFSYLYYKNFFLNT